MAIGRKSRERIIQSCMGLALAFAATFTVPTARAQGPAPWSFFGNDIGNTRGHVSGGYNVGAPNQISTRTASKLALKWSYSTVGDISATPTAEAAGVYFPDYAGFLYALNPGTGARIWSAYLANYLGGTYGYSRSSPAIGALGEIVIGNNSPNASSTPGARVLSINKSTGALNWTSVVDSNPNAFITTSAVIYKSRIYVGVASLEESLAANVPNFVASFRGSIVCLDEATGSVIWKFYTVPQGYTGAAVWGSSPAIWTQGSAVLVATGNNYSVPTSVGQCLTTAGSSVTAQYACLDPTDYVDSVLSIDVRSGTLNWSRRFAGADTWNIACSKGPASACPVPPGLDNDFAQAPNLSYVPGFTGVPDDRGGSSAGYILGAGEKSGTYWGLNPANGGLFWSTYVGRGQILWGSAVNTDDHNAFYTALSNTAHYTQTLAGQNGTPITSNAGAWGSINIATGAFNWQIPAYGTDLGNPKVGAAAPGPVTFTNRVLFAGSTSGYFVGLNATSGRTLWTYNAGGTVIGGPSVYNETLFWGAGATKSGAGSVHTLFAFSVGGT